MPAKPYLLTMLFWLVSVIGATAQGFAGLGTKAEGFEIPRPDVALQFPRDHGSHPDFRIEWWYVTATLTGADGRDYGVQWTLFRSALAPREAPGWQSPQIWMGHAALTSSDQHYVAERLARGGIGQAGVTTAPFAAWIDDWSLAGVGDATLSELSMNAAGPSFSYNLQLMSDGPLVLQGQNGYSEKSDAGQASYYYSQPFYLVQGTLQFPDGPMPVTGQAWLDREWSSQPLSKDQTGWDWFSLSFENGDKMMAFRLRGSSGDFTSGTWISSDGRSSPIPNGTITLEPLKFTDVEGRDIPVRWRLVLPDRSMDIEVHALNSQSWMNTSFPYWEGPVSVEGSHAGRGYLEMTGYSPRP